VPAKQVCSPVGDRCVQIMNDVVVVGFIDRNENSEQRDKQKTLLSNCKNTANTYKSTISQDNNHQVKFKLTQEKNEITVSIMSRQYQRTYATNCINISTIKKQTLRG